MLQYFIFLLCLAFAKSRDSNKAMKAMPVITNSLVNMGKLDIAFYMNAKPDDMKQSLMYHPSPFAPKQEIVIEEPCPCSSLRHFKDSSLNPSEMLQKLLTNNDFFTSKKDPVASPLCCDSHENIKEDTILFEFGPKHSQMMQTNKFPPFLFDSLLSNKPSLPSLPFKPKAVEIFFLPQKKSVKDNEFVTEKIYSNKKTIQIVGDKEIKNDFKAFQLKPTIGSVKKDLNVQEKHLNNEAKEINDKKINVSVSNTNSV